MCANCTSKNQIIEAQQTEIARLRATITRAKQATDHILITTTESMKSHHPRGTWALLRGRKEAAQEIDRFLR